MKEFGSQMARGMFSLQHFRGYKEFRWSSIMRKLSTTQVRGIKSYTTYDHNLPAIKILQKKKKRRELLKAQQEEKQAKKEASNKPKPSKEEQVKNTTQTIKINAKGTNQNNEDDDSGTTKEIRAKTAAHLAKLHQDKDLDS